MRRTFQCLDQILHVVVAEARGQTYCPGVDYERFLLSPPGRLQTQPKKVVHGGLQRSIRASQLTTQQFSDIVIERKSNSHTFDDRT